MLAYRVHWYVDPSITCTYNVYCALCQFNKNDDGYVCIITIPIQSPNKYDITEKVVIGSIPISGTATATATLYDQSSNELACIQMTASV